MIVSEVNFGWGAYYFSIVNLKFWRELGVNRGDTTTVEVVD